MWLLLKENVLDKFNIDSQSTYLIKLDKTNFLVGKNNSGKSYYLRFLLRNALKIYEDDNAVIEDIKKVILNDNEVDFKYLSEFESIKANELYKRYYGYILLIDKANDIKRATGSVYSRYGAIVYNYPKEQELLEELTPLFEYLNVSKNRDTLNIQIIHKETEIKSKILKDFKAELIEKLDYLTEKEINCFGKKFGTIQNNNQIQKFYFPILRSIRHPLKDTKSVGDINIREDIYKERINSEYCFDSDINIVTGLDFYQDYKNNLLGSKEKREKINI